jgi:hypothetical protein
MIRISMIGFARMSLAAPANFMIVADGFGAFADAFRRKLSIEIAGTPPRALAAAP